MSHSLQKVNIGNSAFVVVKIIDYVQGGETITPSELGLATAITSVTFLLTNGDVNGAGPMPVFAGSLIKLVQTGGSNQEIPSTAGLNYSFSAIIRGTPGTGMVTAGDVAVYDATGGLADSGTQLSSLSGGGGATNKVQAIVDFGNTQVQETTAQAVATAAWVTAASVLMCSVVEGQDHTADEISAEQVTASVGSIQPGVGFTVSMSAPNGASGKFLVNIVGF